jgi:hypothetical protein
MSGYLIAITGMVYAWVSWDQFVRGNDGLAIAYAGYAFSNIGLWMLAK